MAGLDAYGLSRAGIAGGGYCPSLRTYSNATCACATPGSALLSPPLLSRPPARSSLPRGSSQTVTAPLKAPQTLPALILSVMLTLLAPTLPGTQLLLKILQGSSNSDLMECSTLLSKACPSVKPKAQQYGMQGLRRGLCRLQPRMERHNMEERQQQGQRALPSLPCSISMQQKMLMQCHLKLWVLQMRRAWQSSRACCRCSRTVQG